MNIYKTPEEMAEYISEQSGEKVSAAEVKRVAREGRLADENGLIGLYELIAYLAVVVK